MIIGVSALRVLLCLVVVFSAFRYLHDLLKILLSSPFIDFAHYYTYVSVVASGLDPFDPEAVARVDELLRVRRAGAAANYPPLFYLLMQPWVLLPFQQAAFVWLVAGQACLFGALAVCLRVHSATSPIPVAAALFVVLNYQPLMESLALGQANCVILLLVSLAWWGLRTGHSWIAAGAVAVALHIKIQYGLLLLLLWWMGSRVVSLRAFLLAGLGLAVGMMALGPAHHVSYLRYVLSLPDYLLTWTANISPRATFHRLFEGFSQGAILADSLWLTLVAALLFLIARSIPHPLPHESPALDWAWGLGLCAVLLLSPVTEEHHLVVLLLPLMLLVLRGPDLSWRPMDVAVLVGSILLLGSRYSLEQFPVFHHGALSLLATGKLLGVFGLSWVLMTRLRREHTRS